MSRYDILFYYGHGCAEEARLLEKICHELRDDAHLVVFPGVHDILPQLEMQDCGAVKMYRGLARTSCVD